MKHFRELLESLANSSVFCSKAKVKLHEGEFDMVLLKVRQELGILWTPKS